MKNILLLSFLTLISCGGSDDSGGKNPGETVIREVAICDQAHTSESLPFHTGNGSEESPYTICDASQFLEVANSDTTKIYELGDDLDFDSMTITPIGNSTSPFMGRFEGNDYSLKNINISEPTLDNQGVFGVIGSDGEVSDLNITSSSVEGRDNSGLVSGTNNGLISGVVVSGSSVTGNNSVGGLTGNNNGSINSSSVTDTSFDGNDSVGGIAGTNSGDVTDSEVIEPFVTSGSNGGAVVGRDFGSVSGTSSTGGLINPDPLGTLASDSPNKDGDKVNYLSINLKHTGNSFDGTYEVTSHTASPQTGTISDFHNNGIEVTILPNQSNIIEVDITDVNENTTIAQYTVEHDDQAPSITLVTDISSELSNGFPGATHLLEFTTDKVVDYDVDYIYDGGIVTNGASGNSSSFSYNVPVSMIEDDPNKLVVNVADSFGNTNSTSISGIVTASTFDFSITDYQGSGYNTTTPELSFNANRDFTYTTSGAAPSGGQSGNQSDSFIGGLVSGYFANKDEILVTATDTYGNSIDVALDLFLQDLNIQRSSGLETIVSAGETYDTDLLVEYTTGVDISSYAISNNGSQAASGGTVSSISESIPLVVGDNNIELSIVDLLGDTYTDSFLLERLESLREPATGAYADLPTCSNQDHPDGTLWAVFSASGDSFAGWSVYWFGTEIHYEEHTNTGPDSYSHGGYTYHKGDFVKRCSNQLTPSPVTVHIDYYEVYRVQN